MLARLGRRISAQVLRQSCHSEVLQANSRIISRSMFIEIKEHDKIMKEEVKDMNLRPRVLTAFDMILQMNQLEIAELSWAIQVRIYRKCK